MSKKTRMMRIEKQLLDNLRINFPSVRSDNDRVASLLDQHIRFQGAVNGVGGFLYGSKTWKRLNKK